MRALAVFHDHGAHALDRFLKRGFRHCFAVVDAGGYWVRLDGHDGRPVVEVVCAAGYDLATFYRQEGFRVIETRQRDRAPLWPLAVANCVGLVKSILCVGAPLALTPWRLYRHMGRGALLPGKSIFSPPKPKLPPPPVIEAPPPPPERADPAVAEAANELRQSELRRRGRAASVLTSGRGVTEDALLGRPGATSAKLGG